MKKILLAASSIVLLAAGCNSSTSTLNTDTVTPTVAPSSQTQAAQNASETPAPPTSQKSATDAELNASLKNVDSNINSLNSDSASIDSSLGEQQAP